MDSRLEAYLHWLADRGLDSPSVSDIYSDMGPAEDQNQLDGRLQDLLDRIIQHCFADAEPHFQNWRDAQITMLKVKSPTNSESSVEKSAIIYFTADPHQLPAFCLELQTEEKVFFAPPLSKVSSDIEAKKSSWVTIQAVQDYLGVKR